MTWNSSKAELPGRAMASRVHTLRLCGLTGDEAVTAAKALLANRDIPDLSHLLVLDDTSLLPSHVDAFEDLLTAGRLHHLLCVAIGPSADGRATVVVPGNISSMQGSAVLWVSDPIGVDWPLAASAVAIIRSARGRTGLDHLVDALSTVEVYGRVREIVLKLPGGVASPGLRLSGVLDDDVSFEAMLTTAIRQIVAVPTQVGAPEPLLPTATARLGAARLAEHGRLSELRDQCVASAEDANSAIEVLMRPTGLLGARRLLPGARDRVIEAGQQLRQFRDEVAALFDYAHAPGGLSEGQRKRVQAIGVLLPDGASAGQDRADGAGQASTGVIGAVAKSVQAGNTLPQVAAQLSADEKRLSPQGSRGYVGEVDRCSDPALTALLADPPAPGGPQGWMIAVSALMAALGSLLGLAGTATGLVLVASLAALLSPTATEQACGSRGAANRSLISLVVAGLAGVAAGTAAGLYFKPTSQVSLAGVAAAALLLAVSALSSWRLRVGKWHRRLEPNRVAGAADALAALVVRVATAEWSTDRALLAEVGRVRIVIKGVSDQLREYADRAEKSIDRSPEPRLVGAIAPTLRRLVLRVLAHQSAPDRSDGQVSYRQAKKTANELLDVWADTAAELGPLAWPPFAQSADDEATETSEHDNAVIDSITLYDPYDVMWQLCNPGDLTMLDTGTQPGVVAFAPQTGRRNVRSSSAETIWTSSGMQAGLVRLVPLRDGGVELEWSAGTREEPFA
jgi:hypothetical protein